MPIVEIKDEYKCPITGKLIDSPTEIQGDRKHQLFDKKALIEVIDKLKSHKVGRKNIIIKGITIDKNTKIVDMPNEGRKIQKYLKQNNIISYDDFTDVIKDKSPIGEHGYFAYYLTEKDKYGWTALHWAADIGNLSALNELLEGKADINAQTINGFTPLHCAAAAGKFEIIDALLKAGAKTNLKDKSGEVANTKLTATGGSTPLHWAAEHDIKTETFKLLVDKTKNINAKNKEGSTALCLAATNGLLEIVKILVERGSGVQAKNQALINAVSADHTDVAQYLIDKGGNVNQTSGKNKDTLLHTAVRNNYKDLCVALLNKGANIYMSNKEDESPVELAKSLHNRELTDLLKRHPNDIKQKTEIDKLSQQIAESNRRIAESNRRIAELTQQVSNLIPVNRDASQNIQHQTVQSTSNWSPRIFSAQIPPTDRIEDNNSQNTKLNP